MDAGVGWTHTASSEKAMSRASDPTAERCTKSVNWPNSLQHVFQTVRAVVVLHPVPASPDTPSRVSGAAAESSSRGQARADQRTQTTPGSRSHMRRSSSRALPKKSVRWKRRLHSSRL